MESILEMIQGLIAKLFGSSAMSVIQSVMDKVIKLIGSIFGSLKPAATSAEARDLRTGARPGGGP